MAYVIHIYARTEIFIIAGVHQIRLRSLLQIPDAGILFCTFAVLFNAGSSIAARIAIMAITTSSSINVNLFNIISWLLLHHFVFLTFSGRESVVSVYYTKLPAQKQERQPFRRYDSSGK